MKMRAILLTFSCAFIPAPLLAQPTKLELRPRVTSVVESIHVKPGASVKKGHLLLRLDAALQKLQVEQARADVALGEAILSQAEADFQRASKLVAAGAIAREEVDALTAKRQQALAGLQARKARLSLAMVNLDHTQLRAPIDGTIERLLVNVGETVRADETIVITLGDGQPQKTSDDVRQLLKERHALLVNIADRIEAQVKSGTGSSKSLIQARRAAAAAELELCDTTAQRIEVLRKDVERVKEMQRIINLQVKAGYLSQVEALEAEAMVLEARIRLAREEAKAVKKEK